MRRIRHLTNRRRTPSTNVALGVLLAFNAGSINAGGFLVLHMYTSHMSGFASQMADGLALNDSRLLLNALGAILSFVTGAAVCAGLVNWGRERGLSSVFALPLALEALLMLLFGLLGAVMLNWNTPFAVPLTVLLLSFIMGLQNAVGSKASGGSIRTTHMTGNITDFGMALGKAFFRRRDKALSAEALDGNRRAKISAALVLAFVLGGMAGALGFKYFGFVCVIPLATLLLLLSIPPLWRDLKS
ncbi:YoaK family protein [Ottowia thiooxydans]|uniref:Uncharacterized membrane protein YoaK (UPF0700 family) n=1 Tax=Ottowia thiooxydans TaxID=219182 RepID=A0ABV2Q6Z8_9BURK